MKNFKKYILLITEILLAIIIIVGVIFILNNKNSDKTNTSSDTQKTFSSQTSSISKKPETDKTDLTASKNNSSSKNTSSNTDIDTAWKKAYKKYVIKALEEGYESFDLIYLDNNYIPELYLIGNSEAIGEKICTYHNGKITELSLSRLSGMKYKELSGDFIHSNGNMGAYYDSYYTLKDGKFILNNFGNYDTNTYEFHMDNELIDGNLYFAITSEWLKGNPILEPQTNARGYAEFVKTHFN